MPLYDNEKAAERALEALGLHLDKMLGDVTDEQIDSLETLLHGRINKLNKDFFRRLAAEIVGVAEPPWLGTDWAPLSTRYVEAKQKKGQSPYFYSATGALGGQLRGLKPPASAIVSRRSITRIGNPQVFTKIIKGGRIQAFRPSGRGRQMVFASKRDLYIEVRNVVLSVVPIIGLVDTSSAASTLLPSKDVAYKLTNPVGRELRPALAPYINWWLSSQVEPLVQRTIAEWEKS